VLPLTTLYGNTACILELLNVPMIQLDGEYTVVKDPMHEWKNINDAN